MRNKLRLGCLLVAVAGLWAQDPPSRVARLNLIVGQVSFQPATIPEWTAATQNYPCTIGDQLYADADSRAELHVGSTAIRLGPSSSMSFLNLDDHLVQIRLDQGALIVRVRYLEPDDGYEIDTPQGAVTILRPGVYRVDADPARNVMMVTVRSGDAAITSNAGGFPVHAQQTASVGADGHAVFQPENNPDPFDLFGRDQDRGEDRMGSPRYVSRELPGWIDLDRSGQWDMDPAYGPVWKPTNVPPTWAPYRYGRWAWVDPWGWTWIDDAAWGFAPFHYGRWVKVNEAWVWNPGLLPAHPVYAPALVVFAGGAAFSLAVAGAGATGAGSAPITWFPLGPKEIYVPAYAATPRYVDRVNVTTVNIATATLANKDYMNAPAGVTAVNQRVFVSAQPVGKALVKIPPEAINRAEIQRTAAVVPEQVSVLAHAGGAEKVPHPAAELFRRTVFAQHTPPPAAVPFASRLQALRAHPGIPAGSQATNQLRAGAAIPSAPPVQSQAQQPQVQQPKVHVLEPSAVLERPKAEAPPPLPSARPSAEEVAAAAAAAGKPAPRPAEQRRADQAQEIAQEKAESKEKADVDSKQPQSKDAKAAAAWKKKQEQIKRQEENDR